MASQVRTSIVIASRDRADELKDCIRSISEAISAADEIIVVDSASADRKAVSQVAISSGARLIRTETPGSAAARNLGIQQARGEFIAFTDDDARVDKDWLNRALQRFSDSTVAAVVGPVLEFGPSPSLVISFAEFDAAHDEVRFNRKRRDWFARIRYGAIGCGANLVVRRSAFTEHGLFRESLGKGAPIVGDETYFLLTLVERGATVVNEPAARVFHPRQSVARILELRRSAIAYFLYVAITRPQLWPRIATRFITKHLAQGLAPGSTGQSSSDLLKSLILAPAMLIAAFRIDRAAMGNRCEPGIRYIEQEKSTTI